MPTYRTTTHPGRSPEEARAAKALLEAAKQDARDNWDRPEWHREQAAVMTETIFLGFEHVNLLSMLTEVETVDEGDEITVDEVYGLEAHWVSVGGNIDQSTLQDDSMRLVEDLVGFHVTENEDAMRANYPIKQSNVIGQAEAQMDAEINLRLLRLYEAAIPDGSSPSYMSGAGFTLPMINAAIRDVEDQTFLQHPAIIARAPMINELMDLIADSSSFIPETQEEIIKLGIIAQYRGCKIVKLINYRDRFKRPFFPANELYVAGMDAAKFGFWGGLTAKEWIEEGGDDWHYRGRRKVGGVVTHPERVKRIVDTSIPPGQGAAPVDS